MRKNYQVIYSLHSFKDLTKLYIVFYRVDEKQANITIIRIFYSRNNIESVIKNTSN